MPHDSALAAAEARLGAWFGATVGPAVVHSTLVRPYDELRGRSRVTDFLPSLAERLARRRLADLARPRHPASHW